MSELYAVPIKCRSSVNVFLQTVRALFLRELRHQVNWCLQVQKTAGLFKLLVEPLAQIIFWSGINAYFGSGEMFGLWAPYYIFIGVMLWVPLNRMHYQAKDLVRREHALFIHRQVKPITLVISIMGVEFLIVSWTAIILTFLTWLTGHMVFLKHPFLLMAMLFFHICFVFGFSVCMMTLCFYSQLASQYFEHLLIPIYLSSGIFYGTDMMYKFNMTWIIKNPIFQIINGVRCCFSDNPELHGKLHIVYLALFCLIFVSFSLILYFLNRKLFMERLYHA